MNFSEADYVMTNTPGMLRAMGGMMTAMGVKPEIEAFDTGHLWFAKQLVDRRHPEAGRAGAALHGRAVGAPDDLNTFMAMVNNVPPEWTFSAFSLGRNQMAYAAAAVIAGGNVRVGLEDNLWLDKGVLATNAQLGRAGGEHRRESWRAGDQARGSAPEAGADEKGAGGGLTRLRDVVILRAPLCPCRTSPPHGGDWPSSTVSPIGGVARDAQTSQLPISPVWGDVRQDRGDVERDLRKLEAMQ